MLSVLGDASGEKSCTCDSQRRQLSVMTPHNTYSRAASYLEGRCSVRSSHFFLHVLIRGVVRCQ